MTWEFDSERPIYIQLVERLTLLVLTGRYPSGGRLPSVRELAAEARVNPNTMQRALAELEQRGLLNSERTNGRFVTEDESLLKQEKRRLAQGYLEKFFRTLAELGYDQQQALALAAEWKGEQDND